MPSILVLAALACLGFAAPPEGVVPIWRVRKDVGGEHPIRGLGTDEKVKNRLREFRHPREVTADLPVSFDARQQWPECMTPVRDQANCGSCWAHGAVEALSDRLCIAGITGPIQLAPQWMVNCDHGNMGCMGGQLPNAWSFMSIFGVSDETCTPYIASNAECTEKCVDGTAPTLYYADGGKWFPPDDLESIMYEIMTYGPLETAFSVYEDFYSDYAGGVYQHTYGDYKGGHAIKVLGWGHDDESGLDYWIAQNSWGPEWGEDGFFRIVRGTNDCGFEGQMTGGHAAAEPYEPPAPKFASDYYTVFNVKELGIHQGTALWVKDGGVDAYEDAYAAGGIRGRLAAHAGVKGEGWSAQQVVSGGMEQCVCSNGPVGSQDILSIVSDLKYNGSHWSGADGEKTMQQQILSDYVLEIGNLESVKFEIACAAIDGLAWPWRLVESVMGLEVELEFVIYEERDNSDIDFSAPCTCE